MKLFQIPVVCVLFGSIFMIGCSQTSVTVNDVQKYTPAVESMAQGVTAQLLVDKPDNVKKSVNALATAMGDVLAGEFTVNEAQVDSLINLAIEKSKIQLPANSPVKPILKSVLLSALVAAEKQVNKTGADIASKNETIMAFVRAAITGIEKGSVVVN